MHKWLQLPATPTDDPLATVYPINQYRKSHVYAVTRINPIYVDDEHRGGASWDKSRGSSGYESQPHSDHSSLDKSSPPATQSLRSAGSPPGSSRSSSGKSSQKPVEPWLSPIKEGVMDAHEYCIPRPVWPGYGGDAVHAYPDPERIPRVRCCRHCARCKCRRTGGGGSSSNSGYSSACSGGTISTISSGGGGRPNAGAGEGTGSSDEVSPSSGTVSVKSNTPSELDARRHYHSGAGKTQANDWNSMIDLRLNQKTDNLQYDCGAVLRGLQFTLDAQQAEKLMQKIKVSKKQRCWCRVVTACLGLFMFIVSVVTVSLALTRGQKMFGSL
ncbi:uncharacterized protein LOC126845614 [Adelges cooleyi]|uniref:uncharacterized protein LOC126845614 n=1 Tax=Adelges cooleyi TaxID=133065 RepID=UPI00217FE233|nr:uncharacterized protein LOC126845614 [Adelges cooleyi]XP_050440333.1 uncharacterized protein LOC126845614 [Adelges cooleyi]XP_050440334.1 uncharacterized protein LOC126845614 [Adelges cooleyi]